MKFSEKWLREWIDPPVDTATLGEQLTSIGLEVDTIESAASDFTGVVVARIESLGQHPNAERLRVCSVDAGGEDRLQVVCGAPNAREGLTTVLARVGARLPDGTKLKKAKLRGQISMGMLCSAAELGLSEQHHGILELPDQALPGTDLVELLALDDNIIEIDLTPDRGDCLSIRGIARDLSARNDLSLKPHPMAAVTVHSDARWPVNVSSDSACVRYSGRLLEELKPGTDTPIDIVERLRRSGIRSISPAVDVTNLVMLELGQPMHAFDVDKLRGAIQVRKAVADERLVLLDGREVTLDPDTTVIADDRGAIGIAGIMGGLSTAVDETTTRIFFESALFLPEQIAGKPRRYASHSESAHRFERGVDPAGQLEALEYATGLMQSIAGGVAGPTMDWQDSERMPARLEILLRRERLERVLGMGIEPEAVSTILQRLGIHSRPQSDGWWVTAPSYRYDLSIEEDYIEEVARILGYDSLPRTSPAHRPMMRARPEQHVSLIDTKRLLVSRGYQEVVTYSFVEQSRQQLLRPELKALPLANPISSELAVMRTTLVGGLITTLQYNLARQATSMALFETGLRFLVNDADGPVASLDAFLAADHGDDQQSDSGVQQQNVIAGLVMGRLASENWNAADSAADFYSIKADIEALFAQANASAVRFVPSDLAMLHPGQQAGIEIDGRSVGFVGALNPVVLAALDLNVTPLVFELSLHAVAQRQVPAHVPISRFPQVRRDIALLMEVSVSYQALMNTLWQQAPAMLKDVILFDVYQGEKLQGGKKSMALGLIFQDFSRTLEDQEVEQAVAGIVAALELAHGATLRE